MTLTGLEVERLTKRFPVRGGRGEVHAVDDVSFEIAPGECVGLVGESGCGKSTLARVVARLLDATSGEIRFDGLPIGEVERARIQMVFQDPADSLNPRFSAFDTIADPLRVLRGLRGPALRRRVEEVAGLAGVAPELLGRLPHQLSGGQQQRVGIARAIAVEPRLLVLDEPTSALDVSVQAVILHLLHDLRQRLGMAYLLVSHDLNVVRLLCDRVLVMYLGRLVETGPAGEVFSRPRHPYTRALLAAVPSADPGGRRRMVLAGEPPSPVNPPANACRFASRCPEAFARCREEMPLARGEAHQTACHLAQEKISPG